MALRGLSWITVGALVCGCYRYAPVETHAIAPGAGVRARITPAASQRVAPLLGVSEPRVLVGSLVDRQGDDLIIEVPTAASAEVGSTVQQLFQRVALAPSDVTEVETRTLDRTRTAAVVGLATAAAVAVAIKYLRGEPGLDHPSTGSPPEQRIPLFRFHF
jgi:hypothetical protein